MAPDLRGQADGERRCRPRGWASAGVGVGGAGLGGAAGGTDPRALERLGLTCAHGALPPSGSSVQVELPDPSGLNLGVCDPWKGAREWPVQSCALRVTVPASRRDTARQVGAHRGKGLGAQAGLERQDEA